MKTVVILAVAVTIFMAGCSGEPGQSPPPAPSQASLTPPGSAAEGLRVATRVGCNGCHRTDGGGKVFHDDAEEGRFVAPNLTQRREIYDSAALDALLRLGKTHDGHLPIMMPIRMFQYLSD